MKISRAFLALSFLLTTCFPSLADDMVAPLLDRELFFGAPEISRAQLSPDGRYIAFLSPYNGVSNIWVKKRGTSQDQAWPVTAEAIRPLHGYKWSPDGRSLLFSKDHDGDENYNLYSADPTTDMSNAADDAPRRLTNLRGVQTRLLHLSRAEANIVFIGLNDRDQIWHDLYKVDTSSGERTLIMENREKIAEYIFDNSDVLRAVIKMTPDGRKELAEVHPDRLRTIVAIDLDEKFSPLGFDKENTSLYATSNRKQDLEALVLLNMASGKERLVQADPDGRVDISSVVFDKESHLPIIARFDDGTGRDVVLNEDYRIDDQWLKNQFPGQSITWRSFGESKDIWLIDASSDTEPGETYLFERSQNKLSLQYRFRGDLPRDVLGSMVPLTYLSSDGLEIPALITFPKGVQRKGLPLIVSPHGGPWARDRWGYNGEVQFFANRGYAVLQPNFRGSTGYGKKYLLAANQQWGELMQDDITWGVKHLVEQGIVDPDRVGIFGGSYGGYASLAGATFTPELYSAAVAFMAPSNLVRSLESIPTYWESERKIMYSRIADPNTKEGRALLERQSPINYVDRILTPLMIVQGANDPRNLQRESDSIVRALHQREFPVVYLLADDEGHGFSRPLNNLAFYASTEKFLAQHLGGRYQAEVRPEIQKRIEQMTVDPAQL